MGRPMDRVLNTHSDDPHILRLWALATLCQVKLDSLAFLEAVVSVTHQVRMVDEDILGSCCRGNEPETSVAVEELNRSRCHLFSRSLSLLLLRCSISLATDSGSVEGVVETEDHAREEDGDRV